MSKGLLLNIIMIIGVFQGFITSLLLLFFKHKKNISDYLLIALIIGFSLISCNVLMPNLLTLKFQCIKFPPLSLELFMPPLFLLYVSITTIQKRKIYYKDFLMFIPAIIIYILLVLYFIILLRSFKDEYLETYYFIRKIEDVLLPIFWIIILYKSFSFLREYKKWLINNISDSSWPIYNFLKYSIFLLFLGNFVYIINLSLDFSINFCQTSYMHWQIYFIVTSIIIYYIGFVGYKLPSIKKDSHPFKNATGSKNNFNINDNEIETFKIEIISKIERNKLYTNPELELSTLSSELGLSPQLVSYLINKIFKTNFRNFINNYRIEEVKKNILLEKYKGYSIVGIAFESGFNSEASFYRIFKSKTGISPLDYRKKYSQNI